MFAKVYIEENVLVQEEFINLVQLNPQLNLFHKNVCDPGCPSLRNGAYESRDFCAYGLTVFHGLAGKFCLRA